ncbi:MAG: SWIM zinc finger family protein [Planctomycetota bacterium]
MIAPQKDGADDAPEATDHTDVELSYAGQSQMLSEAGGSRLALFGNLRRDPVFLDGIIRDPLRFREAMGALYAVVGSDYRYVPKDRTKYNAYRRMRNQSANLNAWQAQQAYFQWLSRNDPLAYLILDPVITVHPDSVFMEVFSKDEGTYANLSVDRDAFELDADPVCGTTNIDFSQTLYDSIQQFRTYRETRVTIAQDAVKVSTSGEDDVLEKQIRVPDSWMRGFLQVQSSTLLPMDSFRVNAIDLYNVLRHLRMNGDRKGKRRGLRVELVPGERPRIVLEPWETVFETNAEIYQGRQAKVTRIWGRRRLMLLRRMLPFVTSVDVHLLGSGLPSFWVLSAGAMTFTLGLTGFTASNWSQAVNFDLLMPRQTDDGKHVKKVVKHLSEHWHSDRDSIEKATKLKDADLTESLQRGCQQGQLMYDLAKTDYRLRPLTNVPIDLERIEYRSSRERLAHDLVHRKGAVSIVSENRIHGTGLELTGKAVVAEDKREYRPQMLLSDEGFVSRAECTCNEFRRQGLKYGPCTCLIALRLNHAMREKRRKEGGQGMSKITVETRTFSRRTKDVEQVVQITLDRKRLKVRWGNAGEAMRLQQLQFDSVDDARGEYIARVTQLETRGYLDASA